MAVSFYVMSTLMGTTWELIFDESKLVGIKAVYCFIVVFESPWKGKFVSLYTSPTELTADEDTYWADTTRTMAASKDEEFIL